MSPWLWLAAGVGAYLLLRRSTPSMVQPPAEPERPMGPGTPGYSVAVAPGYATPQTPQAWTAMITQAQQALAALMLYTGPIDGEPNADTIQGLKNYVARYPTLGARIDQLTGVDHDAAMLRAVIAGETA